MKLPKIIAVVGMPGSGKGTVVDYLTNKLDCPSVYLGGMVYEEVARRGLDIVKDEIWVREDMRRQEGMAVMAKRAAVKAKEFLSNGAKTVVLDGVYSWSEDKFLRGEFGDDIIVLAVVVQKQIRYQRAIKRVDKKPGGQVRKYTVENIVVRDITEIENIEKGGPIAYADYFVLNDSDFDSLYTQIDKII
jgi:dephospho-CoA kinase